MVGQDLCSWGICWM